MREKEENFCCECAMSFNPVAQICLTRDCNQCGKKVYFERRTPEGGLKIEKGDSFCVTHVTMSLNPLADDHKSWFTRSGLEHHLEVILFGGNTADMDPFFAYCKEKEKALDEVLTELEYINHLDLNDRDDCREVEDILTKQEGAELHLNNFYLSSYLSGAHHEGAAGNTELSALLAYKAGLTQGRSLLKDEHFKEIVWLGYQCYVDIKHNEAITQKDVIKKRVVDSAAKKIAVLSEAQLVALGSTNNELGRQLGISGVDESALLALINNEIQKREATAEQAFREREVTAKESMVTIKAASLVWTITFAAGMAIGKYLLS